MSAETAAPTSLVLYRESLADSGDEKRCPRKLNFDLMCLETGQVVPARCMANKCEFCGPINARLVGGAITLANPERFITFTQVGDDWPTIQARMNRVNYEVRRACGSEHTMAWQVEPNPNGTGHHAHCWQRGPYLPQARLVELADSEGIGRVTDIKKWVPTKKATTYGVKLLGVTYGGKLTEDTESMATYLGCNGNRLVHASRGFWQVDGRSVGQREAMAAWRRKQASEDNGTWVVVRRAVSA